MRFGRDLHRHRIPEWSAAYLNYDELKKSIKFATKSALDDGSQVEGQGENDWN
jgi:glycerophosphodiester phosphodiesterase